MFVPFDLTRKVSVDEKEVAVKIVERTDDSILFDECANCPSKFKDTQDTQDLLKRTVRLIKDK